ncbi:hypothetical protein T4E_5862 [Trichinella pseudospiralis]|uniref:Uncharacterized protein n=1 Tax=Trichinella pseudospiralis TaxID=6337 RepID=A0A0V0XCD6_TRIPS|nr:hypothetical protein T4E_5862 [Trichinella pseudospiralis]
MIQSCVIPGRPITTQKLKSKAVLCVTAVQFATVAIVTKLQSTEPADQITIDFQCLINPQMLC